MQPSAAAFVHAAFRMMCCQHELQAVRSGLPAHAVAQPLVPEPGPSCAGDLQALSPLPDLLFVLRGRLAADQGDNPVALQEALIELEKGKGPSHWIGSKIPTSISSSKIWRTLFWVSLHFGSSGW